MARQPLYLLLLGIAGNAQDAAGLEQRLEAAWTSSDATNVGPMIAADLELKGPARMAWVDERYMRDQRRSTRELEAALLALSVQGNANGVIPRERVIQSYRTFIKEHREIAGFVAQDLAAWQYWDAVPEYVALMKSGVRQQYASRIAIAAYLRQSPAGGADVAALGASDPRATEPAAGAARRRAPRRRASMMFARVRVGRLPQQYPSRIAIVAYLRQYPNATAIDLPLPAVADAGSVARAASAGAPSAACIIHAAGRAKRVALRMKRLLREPLVHFLLLGALLFGVYAYAERGRGGVEPSTQIQLSLDDLAQLAVLFQSQWKRDPTPEEFGRMVETKVQEEVLYREGLAMGLDKDDTIVKRRMAQKMQFIAEDVAAAREPTSAELKAWFEKNADKFQAPPRVSFRHLYFSPDKRGTRAKDDAVNALAKLAGQPEDAKLAATLADPFMFQEYYRDRAPDYLGKEFGPVFALAVVKLPPGSWQGPIESGFGWHLVFVDTLVPGRVPSFEEIEGNVKTAWLSEQKATAWEKAYKDMRAKYTVLMPAPPDAQTAARVAAAPRRKEIPTSSGEGAQ